MAYFDGPVQLGDDLADGLGGAGGGGDDVLAGATAVSPQLARGAVHGLLSGGDGVNCALGGRTGSVKRVLRQRGHQGPAPILTIRPSMMPKLSLMTLARGARQLVVQEALLRRQRQL